MVEPKASLMFTNISLFTKFIQSFLNAITILPILSTIELVFNYSIYPLQNYFEFSTLLM